MDLEAILRDFIEWNNENYNEGYIPNSRLGKYLMEKRCEGKESPDESGNCIKPDVMPSFCDDEENEDFEEEEPDYKECMCCGNIQQSGMSCDKCCGPLRDGFL